MGLWRNIKGSRVTGSEISTTLNPPIKEAKKQVFDFDEAVKHGILTTFTKMFNTEDDTTLYGYTKRCENSFKVMKEMQYDFGIKNDKRLEKLDLFMKKLGIDKYEPKKLKEISKKYLSMRAKYFNKGEVGADLTVDEIVLINKLAMIYELSKYS